jgi:hypothetical protein
MTPAEFVACVAREKENLLAMCIDPNSGAAAATQISALGLTIQQQQGLERALDSLLTDAYYSFILALDGAGSIGGQQHDFELRDEGGNILSGGELEGPAWDYFHGQDTK